MFCGLDGREAACEGALALRPTGARGASFRPLFASVEHLKNVKNRYQWAVTRRAGWRVLRWPRAFFVSVTEIMCRPPAIKGEVKRFMLNKKFLSALAAFVLTAAALFSAPHASASTVSKKDEARASRIAPVRVALNLAILVQDDAVSRVGNELELTREYIRALPAGSRVMVAYVRAGSLQVRQGFTTDLEAAAKALRVPAGTTAVAPYNPYVGVKEALKVFQPERENRNAILLISDGLDTSRGFDWSSAVDSVDLRAAVSEARKRNVAIYSFYVPTAGLTSWNSTAISFGQSALNRLSNETGGRAFFQGTGYVTFDSYFKSLSRTINEQYSPAE